MQRVCGRLAPDLLQRVGEPRALVDGGRLRALVPRLLVHERHHHHLARIGALPSRRAPRVKHSPNSNPRPTCMSILITISRASEPCRRGAREHERARNLTRPTHTAARAARCPSWHPSGSCAPLPAKARARCQCCRARAAAPACCTSACPHLSTSGARRGGGRGGRPGRAPQSSCSRCTCSCRSSRWTPGSTRSTSSGSRSSCSCSPCCAAARAPRWSPPPRRPAGPGAVGGASATARPAAP